VKTTHTYIRASATLSQLELVDGHHGVDYNGNAVRLAGDGEEVEVDGSRGGPDGEDKVFIHRALWN